MKALSIRQPWAWLIIQGIKDVENRSWRITNPPNTFYIHVSKTYDNTINTSWIRNQIKKTHPELINEFDQKHSMRGFQKGGIIGTVDLVKCVHYKEYDSPWLSGPYGFILKNPQPIEFIPYRGQLGFFNIDFD